MVKTHLRETDMDNQKKQMAEAAILYYEKKYTQQEIARLLNLTRQTVSKLLSDAVKENIVEIKIRDPQIDSALLEEKIRDKFKIKSAQICSVSGTDETLNRLMIVKKASKYIMPLIKEGNKKIAISWGRTIEALIHELEHADAAGNVAFPLFGATDSELSCFLSNEIARSFAEKIGANIKYAWFPYLPDSESDCELFKNTSYYKRTEKLWGDIDIAIVGIGNNTILKQFEASFGKSNKKASVAGDIATHFFDADGKLVSLYENTLCASFENLRAAKHTVAIAGGTDKAQAIAGALRTGAVDTLITDEHTAKKLLAL